MVTDKQIHMMINAIGHTASSPATLRSIEQIKAQQIKEGRKPATATRIDKS